jgi:hypothetical protein
MDNELQTKVNNLINAKVSERGPATPIAEVIYVITWKNIKNSRGDSGVSLQFNC